MNPYLQKAVNKATEVCKQTIEPTGYTDYLGTGRSNEVYPFLFNILINLNLQILEKLEVLQELESKQKFDKELDKLSEQLVNLSLGKPVEVVNKTPELYKFWIPRK